MKPDCLDCFVPLPICDKQNGPIISINQYIGRALII